MAHRLPALMANSEHCYFLVLDMHHKWQYALLTIWYLLLPFNPLVYRNLYIYIYIYTIVCMCLYLHIYTCVISCFPVAVIKHHDQSNLQKEEFILAYSSREMSSCHDDGRESW